MILEAYWLELRGEKEEREKVVSGRKEGRLGGGVRVGEGSRVKGPGRVTLTLPSDLVSRVGSWPGEIEGSSRVTGLCCFNVFQVLGLGGQ
jgi:hypothetical protein